MKLLLRSVLVSLLATLVVLVPRAALAHDELIASDPEDGSTVQTPTQVALTFSGQVAEVGAAVEVTDAQGETVSEGDPAVEGITVTQPLAADLPGGDYEVAWRVTSSDGHPISGTFDFTVEAAPEETTDEPATEEPTEEPTAQPTTEETAEPTTEEATTDAPAQTQDATEASDEGDGLPVWVWVVVGLAVLGLAALLARTVSRNRD